MNLYFKMIPENYSFNVKNTKDYGMAVCVRIPLYFFYTSISYLFKNKAAIYNKSLNSFLNLAYTRIFSRPSYKTGYWKWLFSDCQKLFIFFQEKKTKNSSVNYDIFTVSFIYNEMQSDDLEVKTFFC